MKNSLSDKQLVWGSDVDPGLDKNRIQGFVPQTK